MTEYPDVPVIIEVEQPAPEIVVLRVRGEVDLLNIDRLEQAISEQIRRQPAHIVIDLTELRFLASPGIAVLINAANLRPDLQLVAAGPIIPRALQLLGMDRSSSWPPDRSSRERYNCSGWIDGSTSTRPWPTPSPAGISTSTPHPAHT